MKYLVISMYILSCIISATIGIIAIGRRCPYLGKIYRPARIFLVICSCFNAAIAIWILSLCYGDMEMLLLGLAFVIIDTAALLACMLAMRKSDDPPADNHHIRNILFTI